MVCLVKRMKKQLVMVCPLHSSTSFMFHGIVEYGTVWHGVEEYSLHCYNVSPYCRIWYGMEYGVWCGVVKLLESCLTEMAECHIALHGVRFFFWVVCNNSSSIYSINEWIFIEKCGVVLHSLVWCAATHSSSSSSMKQCLPSSPSVDSSWQEWMCWVTILEVGGCGFGHQVHTTLTGPGGRFANTWLRQWLQIFHHHNRKLIIKSDIEPTRSQLSRMCCVTQRMTQVRNVDGGCWSLQARGADADLHGVGLMLTYMAWGWCWLTWLWHSLTWRW